MNLLRMRGPWNPWMVRLFDAVVSRGAVDAYALLADEAAARLLPAGRVLDVGCGAARLDAELARRRPDLHFVAVDLSPDMILLARSLAPHLPNLELHTADALHLPFADRSFDAVLSIASIKHWPDPARGVREMARVARPGARLLLLEADPHASPAAIEAFVRPWRFVPLPLALLYFRHVVAAQGIPADRLGAWLRAAGCEEVVAFARTDAPAACAVGRRR